MTPHLERASNVLTHYVLPLYGDDQRGLPEQIGTGFMVCFEGRHYLITAAHVLDHRSRGRLYFYSDSNVLVSVAGRTVLSGAGVVRSADPVDVAVVQLRIDAPVPPYRNLQKLAFDMVQLRQRDTPRAGCEFLLLGFPSTKNEFRRGDVEVRAQAYAYHGVSPEASSVYTQLGLTEEAHVLVKFKQRQGYRAGGGRIDFPKPQGMSGGPLLLYDSDRPIDYSFGFPVVAVATRHRRHEKLLQGTDISFALQFIYELHARADAVGAGPEDGGGPQVEEM